MSIDIDKETIIGVCELGKVCPGPRKPSRATAFRWILTGLRVPGSDQRVKLESLKLNGLRCTSLEALGRFLRAANGQATVPTVTSNQRQKQAEIACRQCEAGGF